MTYHCIGLSKTLQQMLLSILVIGSCMPWLSSYQNGQKFMARSKSRLHLFIYFTLIDAFTGCGSLIIQCLSCHLRHASDES